MQKTRFLGIAALLTLVLLAVPAPARAANPLEALGSMVGSLTSSGKFELSSLVGTWTYESPAVAFKSDNALNKIGGAAASATIEKKLEPYYRTLGLNRMAMVVEAEGDSIYNFALQLGKLPVKGTLSKDGDEGMLTFNFAASGLLKLGSLSAKAETDATGKLSLTFDATRFMEIISKIAGATGNATLKSVTKLLDGYDGLYIGAKMASDNAGNATTNALGKILGGLKK